MVSQVTAKICWFRFASRLGVRDERRRRIIEHNMDQPEQSVLTQTSRQTHGFVALETRVFPVNIRAPTIHMEKSKIATDPTYLNRTRGVSLTSWTSSCEGLPSSISAAVMMV